MDKYVGKRLDGRYEIREIIGMGGMAVVYKAFDNVENKIVAIKILKDEFSSNEEFLRRFRNESKAIAMLTHPNIVDVYDVSFGDLIQYIVMEYIDGCTLKEYIEREGSLTRDDAVYFTMQILKALQHAHDKGIVHRDVKPQNIMILPDGTIKVMDFGIARFSRSDQRTITDKAIGSVHYISPEQARGERTDEKADIYSVGVMLYEMLTGKLPFQAESAVSVAIMQLQRDPELPTEINPSIPKGLEQITMHAMQKTPERRYQSAAEMLCDLNEFRKDPAALFNYSYFVDDSPTKFVGGLEGKLPENKEPVTNYNADDESNEKSNTLPILAGVAVAFVIALISLAIIFIPKLFSDTGEEFECPNFIGSTVEEVRENSKWNSLLIIEYKWDENAEYKYGIVYDQSKTAGKKLKKDDNITLFVSLGQATKKVPDVYGMLESAAVSQLETEGFRVITAEEYSTTGVEKGLVNRTVPPRTTRVAEGEKITVFISLGKPTKKVPIINVVSKNWGKTTKKLITDGGLKYAEEEIYLTPADDWYPVGYVAKQEPAETGEEVLEGTEIKVYVCAGYSTDIELILPPDLQDGIYEISLWHDGKMIDKGDTIESGTLAAYTFKDVKWTKESANYVVKIKDSNGKLYDLFEVAVDYTFKKGENGIEITTGSNYPTGSSENSELESSIPSEDEQ